MHNRFALRVFERSGDDAAQALAALQLDLINDNAVTTISKDTDACNSDKSGFDAAELLLLRMFVSQGCAVVPTVLASDVAAAVVKRRGSRRVTDHVITDVTAASTTTTSCTAAATATPAAAASSAMFAAVASTGDASTAVPELKPSSSPVKPQTMNHVGAVDAVSNTRSRGECSIVLALTLPSQRMRA
jgi:hypothetical protein